MELDIVDGFPGDPGDRRVDPHDLLDRLAAEVGAAAQQRLLVRILQQRLQRQPELVAGGLQVVPRTTPPGSAR